MAEDPEADWLAALEAMAPLESAPQVDQIRARVDNGLSLIERAYISNRVVFPARAAALLALLKAIRAASPTLRDLSGVLVDLGDQQLLTEIRAGLPTAIGFSRPFLCPETVAVNDAVYLSAADTVDKATALDLTKTAIGIVVSKPTPTTAFVTDEDEVRTFAGLVPGKSYFVDIVPGGIVADTAPPSAVFAQRVGFARNATTLKVQIV